MAKSYSGSNAKAYTPDPTKYHDLEEIGHLFPGMPQKGTMLPRAVGSYRDSRMPVKPRGKVRIDPGLEGGGFEVNLAQVSNQRVAEVLAGEPDSVFAVMQQLSTTPAPAVPEDSDTHKLLVLPAPNFDAVGGAAKEKARRTGGQAPPTNQTQQLHVPQVKVSTQRPSELTTALPAAPVPQPLPQAPVQPPLPAQAFAPPSVPYHSPPSQQLATNPGDYPPPQFFAPPSHPAANGQPPAWCQPAGGVRPLPLNAALPSVPPPGVELIMDGGHLGLFSSRFHQIKEENGFLVMVYDRRYEGPGSRWAPPRLPPDQRLWFNVPSLRHAYEVSLPGCHITVEHYDVFLAVLHNKIPTQAGE